MSWYMRSGTEFGKLAMGRTSANGMLPKQLPFAIIALVIVATVAASGVAVSSNGPAAGTADSDANGTSGASASQVSALDVSRERSPGARGDATLNKTKLARADEAKSSTQKRRSRLILPTEGGGLPTAATPLVLPFDMAALTLPTQQLQRGMAAIGSGNLMPVSLIGSPGGGSGGSAVGALPAIPGSGSDGSGAVPGGNVAPGATPAPVATSIPTPVPEVPEPSVWLTMLIGFGLTGAVLRGRRARRIGFAASEPAEV